MHGNQSLLEICIQTSGILLEFVYAVDRFTLLVASSSTYICYHSFLPSIRCTVKARKKAPGGNVSKHSKAK